MSDAALSILRAAAAACKCAASARSLSAKHSAEAAPLPNELSALFYRPTVAATLITLPWPLDARQPVTLITPTWPLYARQPACTVPLRAAFSPRIPLTLLPPQTSFNVASAGPSLPPQLFKLSCGTLTQRTPNARALKDRLWSLRIRST